MWQLCIKHFYVCLCLFSLNISKLPWNKQLICHWEIFLWFTIFDAYTKNLITKQRKMAIEPIDFVFIFHCSELQIIRLKIFEKNENIFGNYFQVEIYIYIDRYFTMYCLMILEENIGVSCVTFMRVVSKT